tara:strand:+ start:337 stop:576 length:240 start_codon:yes stop_codon:yes gene_type:complete
MYVPSDRVALAAQINVDSQLGKAVEIFCEEDKESEYWIQQAAQYEETTYGAGVISDARLEKELFGHRPWAVSLPHDGRP